MSDTKCCICRAPAEWNVLYQITLPGGRHLGSWFGSDTCGYHLGKVIREAVPRAETAIVKSLHAPILDPET